MAAIGNWLRLRARWLLGAGGLLAGLVVVYVLPLILVPPEGLDAEKRLKAENDFRGVLVQALGGSLLLVGTARTLHISREGQITERFTRAIDQLGADKLDVRLGGIYALERIGRDSRYDRGPIVEVLTAYLRDHSQRTQSESDGLDADREQGLVSVPSMRLRADFQAVATVLGRSGWARHYKFNLSGVDLRQAMLDHARLNGAVLVGAHLEGASLNGANLKGANLIGAHLEGANLFETHLESANLDGAHLKDADWLNAHLDDTKGLGHRLR